LANPDLIAVKNFDINPFSTSSTWLMQPTVLHKRFSFVIGHLISSGMFEMWKTNFKVYSLFSSLRNVSMDSIASRNQEVLEAIAVGRIYNWANREEVINRMGFTQDMLMEAESVQLKVLEHPLIVFGLFSLISMVAFCLERFVSLNVWRYRFNWYIRFRFVYITILSTFDLGRRSFLAKVRFFQTAVVSKK